MKRPDFYHSRSGNSLRAAIALELCSIDSNRHFLDLEKKEQKAPAYLHINPAGTVPSYVEYDEVGRQTMTLTQSGAILEYLLSKHRPDLIPSDLIDRSLANSNVLAALSDIAVQNALMRYMSFHSGNEAFLRERLLESINAAFLPIRHTRFFGDSGPNIADFAHFPVIFMRQQLICSTADTEHILAWLERMKSIHAVSRSIAYAGLQLPLNP
ncbi:MAG: glutathione S-transferase [Gammaproteobacteria bacterium]|jgi:glutathione S-transferase